jgi:hypothetical protein
MGIGSSRRCSPAEESTTAVGLTSDEGPAAGADSRKAMTYRGRRQCDRVVKPRFGVTSLVVATVCPEEPRAPRIGEEGDDGGRLGIHYMKTSNRSRSICNGPLTPVTCTHICKGCYLAPVTDKRGRSTPRLVSAAPVTNVDFW